MAITHTETQVAWPSPGGDTAEVAADGNQTSEIFTLDDTCVAAQIHLRAEYTGGTAAADDSIAIYLLQTGGDTDGDAGGDEYDTVNHALFLAKLDCDADDPARKTVPLPIPQKGCKLYATGTVAEGGGGNTNPIEVSAHITEQRAA